MQGTTVKIEGRMFKQQRIKTATSSATNMSPYVLYAETACHFSRRALRNWTKKDSKTSRR